MFSHSFFLSGKPKSIGLPGSVDYGVIILRLHCFCRGMGIFFFWGIEESSLTQPEGICLNRDFLYEHLNSPKVILIERNIFWDRKFYLNLTQMVTFTHPRMVKKLIWLSYHGNPPACPNRSHNRLFQNYPFSNHLQLNVFPSPVWLMRNQWIMAMVGILLHKWSFVPPVSNFNEINHLYVAKFCCIFIPWKSRMRGSRTSNLAWSEREKNGKPWARSQM